MKSSLTFFFAVLLTSLFSLNLLARRGGDEVGNGADIPKGGNSLAWFLQIGASAKPRRIHYCYNLSPAFGVKSGAVESELREAFETWTRYVKFKEIYRSDDYVRVVTEGELLPACDGSEDLRFEFGTTNERIEREKRNYSDPLAFVVQESYAPEKGWGKGFIWVAPQETVDVDMEFPDWTEDGSLHALLLHELGHIFGCSHIQGTVMQENIAKLLRDGVWPQQQRGLIDHSREVFVQRRATRCYQGELGFLNHSDSSSQAFEALVGRFPEGPVTAKVQISPQKTQLQVWENGKSVGVFSIVSTGIETQSGIEGAHAFAYSVNFDGNPYSFESLVSGRALGGNIFVGHDEQLNVLVEENVASNTSEAAPDDLSGPLNIKYSLQKVTGERVVGALFTSFPLGREGSRCPQ